jgi:hypothetical protein
MKFKAVSTPGGKEAEMSEDMASSMVEAGKGDDGVGQDATDGTTPSTARGTSLVRYASTRLKGSLVEGVKNVAPASSVGAVVLMVPLAAVIIGIRYRHYQVLCEFHRLPFLSAPLFFFFALFSLSYLIPFLFKYLF